jgi:DNA-binding MarR family transcriptional regulator
MGMIQSERYGIEPGRTAEIASPATQALLIWFLNQHPVSDTWHPFEVAAALGYAGMTATRAVRELLQFDLFALQERGRAKHLKLIDSRRALWEKAKPYLRTPVIKTLWTYDRGILDVADARFAGESALARLSMLNEPQQPVIAIASEAVQQARQEGIFFEPREPADAIAVQIWRYIPNMLAKEKIVDPLSLWLSLKNNPDDRIQMALDDIEENFLW